jgi:hypothetical protein
MTQPHLPARRMGAAHPTPEPRRKRNPNQHPMQNRAGRNDFGQEKTGSEPDEFKIREIMRGLWVIEGVFRPMTPEQYFEPSPLYTRKKTTVRKQPDNSPKPNPS